MVRFASIMSKKGNDVTSLLAQMTEATSNSFTDSIGVSTIGNTIISKKLNKSDVPDSTQALCCMNKIIEPDDPDQPLSQYGYSFSIDGRLWEGESKPSISQFADELGRNPAEGLRKLIIHRDGSYAVNILDRNGIIAGRDPIGVAPIYMGENDELIAVSSNKKMLWALGLKEETFPPGHIAILTTNGITLNPVSIMTQPPILNINMEEAVRYLDKLIMKAVTARCRGHFKVSLGFSGGIDSSLLAYYIKENGLDVELICVGMEDTNGILTAQKAAELLDMPLTIETFTKNDIEDDLDSVLWSIEESNSMMVSISIPIYWTAKVAAERKNRILFLGNGSDEIFAGYKKHVMKYIESGNNVSKMLLDDIKASYKVNFERDYKITIDQGLELRLPYEDQNIVRWGLSLSPKLKLSMRPTGLRKLILRQLAAKKGLPKEIYEMPKKAIQYSTGVNRTLKSIAKKDGKNLQTFLEKRLIALKNARAHL